jgi:hypothetical protein
MLENKDIYIFIFIFYQILEQTREFKRRENDVVMVVGVNNKARKKNELPSVIKLANAFESFPVTCSRVHVHVGS